MSATNQPAHIGRPSLIFDIARLGALIRLAHEKRGDEDRPRSPAMLPSIRQLIDLGKAFAPLCQPPLHRGNQLNLRIERIKELMAYPLTRSGLAIPIVSILAAIGLPASGAIAAPQRSVYANTITSQRDPAARIRLPDDVTYVGADTFLLTKPGLGNFDACELYAFASGGADGALRKVYWVQFEHYLPQYPEMHFTYDSPRHVTIDGLDFFVDVNVTQGDGKPKPGSDGDHFYTLLARHGYKRVPMMYVRFVHLLDGAKRKELMIIVGEALPDGLTAAAVKKGGAAHARWPAMEKNFVARAARSITITPQSRTK